MEFITMVHPGQGQSRNLTQQAHSHAARVAHARTRRRRMTEFLHRTSAKENPETLNKSPQHHHYHAYPVYGSESGISASRFGIRLSIPDSLSSSFEHEPLASFLRSLTSQEHFMFNHCKFPKKIHLFSSVEQTRHQKAALMTYEDIHSVFPDMQAQCPIINYLGARHDYITSNWILFSSTDLELLKGFLLAASRHLYMLGRDDRYEAIAIHYKLRYVRSLRETIRGGDLFSSRAAVTRAVVLAFDEMMVRNMSMASQHVLGAIQIIQQAGGTKALGLSDLTDGVFQGLADTRLPTPWIEAFRLQQQEKQAATNVESSQKRDLAPKKMSDSYHRVVLPLGQDPWLSDTYINSLGALFMDLDALSGIIVYKHTGPGVTTVTAALDRITIAHPLTEICDLEYSGQVTYASGRSSAEITCKVAKASSEGQPSKPEDVLLTCTFTMVALDSVTRKPVNIPRLLYTTPEEEDIFKAGELNSLSKKNTLKASLLQSEPNDPESALIHRIWLRQLEYHDPNNALRQPRNVVSMAKTQLSTAAIMQPQYRNRHQTMIFGGFHLKQTFELAFCCAASFAHARPTFISADPCTFRNPVPVGSVLYLTATVAYTDPPLLEEDGSEPRRQDPGSPMTRVHVRVDSKVRDVEHGVAKPTGQFNYTFSVPRDLKVLPHTYEEYMIYVDARRRVKLGDNQQKQEAKGSAYETSKFIKDANLME
ncbi:hypothetical protein G7046_g1851 [Stylonectria norvegica]|nr:hypothetical protein G7046_g1851 [Stylonectria norvegica]